MPSKQEQMQEMMWSSWPIEKKEDEPFDIQTTVWISVILFFILIIILFIICYIKNK